MTQKEKLLLKDLCARIPYGPKVKVLHVWNEEKEIEEDIVDIVYCVLPDGYINTETIDSDIPFNNVILYLRPMSSMTAEEEYEYHQYKNIDYLESYEMEHIKMLETTALCFSRAIDWLNKNMFDYHGLISMGLAIEASKDMYKT